MILARPARPLFEVQGRVIEPLDGEPATAEAFVGGGRAEVLLGSDPRRSTWYRDPAYTPGDSAIEWFSAL